MVLATYACRGLEWMVAAARVRPDHDQARPSSPGYVGNAAVSTWVTARQSTTRSSWATR